MHWPPFTRRLLGFVSFLFSRCIVQLRSIIPALHNPLVDDVDFNLIVDHFFGNNATVRTLLDAAYPLSNYPNATVQASMMVRDYFFLCPTSRANLALDALGRTTFLYQNRFLDLTYCTNPTAGVYHSAELQYVWGNGQKTTSSQHGAGTPPPLQVQADAARSFCLHSIIAPLTPRAR